jgi:hypothetical protein
MIVFVRTEFFCRQSVMPFFDRRDSAEGGRRVQGGKCKIKESTIGGKPAIDHIISLERRVRYAPLIVVLFYRPWRRI